MTEADPALIACLYPYYENHLSVENIGLTIERNKSRRIEPLRKDYSRSTSSNNSPASSGHTSSQLPNKGHDNRDNDNGHEYGSTSTAATNDNGHEYGPGLRLGFDDVRKDPVGIIFGTCEQRCDIVLPRERGSLDGLAPVQCAITFDGQGRLLLKDLQSLQDTKRRRERDRALEPGTAVSYNKKSEGQKRCNFTWILGGEDFTKENQPVVIEFHQNLKFRIIVPPRHTNYNEKVARFLSFSADHVTLTQPGVGSMASIHTEAPRQPALLLHSKELGRGGQAVVNKVWNASTGVQDALKEPLTLARWKCLTREINLLKGIRHEHIVSYVSEFSTTAPSPRLVLELAPLGSLDKQHQAHALSVGEAFQTLCQGLSALRYLHGHPEPIVHRDIKPANILVQARDPTHIYIKLSDFGLSRMDTSYLKTYCGTRLYTAPEVFAKMSYDARVDIWSLGLVALQFAHGLPSPGARRLDGKYWTAKIVEVLKAKVKALGCPLLTFLSTAMLVLDPESRNSACRCLWFAQRLNVSEFSCSPAVYRDRHLTSLEGSASAAAPGRHGSRGPDASARGRRSGAPPPASPVCASTVRRENFWRISKPTAQHGSPRKQRGRGGQGTSEVLEYRYFVNKFPYPLHPLFVGSSLGQESNSEWSSGTTHHPGGSSRQSVVRPPPPVVTMWYSTVPRGDNMPTSAQATPRRKITGEESVENRVLLLGQIMQDSDKENNVPKS